MKKTSFILGLLLPVALLSAQPSAWGVKVDGKTLSPLSSDSTQRTLYLPYSVGKTPRITVTPEKSELKFKIRQAKGLNGNDKRRTATIEATDPKSGNKSTCRISFVRLPQLDLYLALGQSNMAGRGKLSPEVMSPIANTYLLAPDGFMDVASNPMNKYSSVRKVLSMQGISPSYSFARKVQQESGRPIGIMQNCLGGSSIQEWTPGSEKRLFEEAIRRAKEAQRYGTIKAIIWHQGEANSRDTLYLNKLGAVVERFRSELNEPNLFFVAGELAQWRGAPFNKRLKEIVNIIPNSDYISSEGAGMLINEKDPHFNTEGNILLGERYAEKVLMRLTKTE